MISQLRQRAKEEALGYLTKRRCELAGLYADIYSDLPVLRRALINSFNPLESTWFRKLRLSLCVQNHVRQREYINKIRYHMYQISIAIDHLKEGYFDPAIEVLQEDEKLLEERVERALNLNQAVVGDCEIPLCEARELRQLLSEVSTLKP